MNSDTLYSMALGLHTTWLVKDMTFSTDKLTRSKLHLPVDFVPGSRFLDEAKERCPIPDTIKRQLQHLSFFEHTFCLHCAMLRIAKTNVAKFVLLICLGHVRGVALPYYSKRWR